MAKLLLKVLAGEQVSGNRRILTPKLVVRDSTAKPVLLWNKETTDSESALPIPYDVGPVIKRGQSLKEEERRG